MEIVGELIPLIVDFFQNNSLILAFISGLLIGDLMLLLGILSGAGKANFFLIILFGIIGGLLHDTIFYFISNSKLMHLLKSKLKLNKKKNALINTIERMGNGNYFVPVLLAKFVYGVRDAVILYVSHNHKNFKKYLFYVGCADLIWITTITGVGWLAGRGFTQIIIWFKGFEKWAFIFLVLIIFLYYLQKFLFKLVTFESDKLVKHKFRNSK